MLFRSQVNVEIEKVLLEKIVADYPFVVSKDIVIQFQDKKEIKFPNSARRFEVDVSRMQTSLGLTSVPVSFLDEENRVVEMAEVWVKTDAKSPFVKSTRSLKKGEKITTPDVKLVVQSIYGSPQNGFRDCKEVVGKEVRYAIGQNSFVTSQTVADPIVVHKGDRVMATLKDGVIEIQMKVEIGRAHV